jgi:hypothetical protein
LKVSLDYIVRPYLKNKEGSREIGGGEGTEGNEERRGREGRAKYFNIFCSFQLFLVVMFYLGFLWCWESNPELCK